MGWMAAADRPLVLGLCGAQGSGKSTLAAALAERLARRGLRIAILSIDDLYLPGAKRQELADTIHPLLRTRGVPGTHDVARGCAILDAVHAGIAAPLPRFDKARDEQAPPDQWDRIDGPVDLLIFEGWCVGARAQGDAALADPCNALERDEDEAGLWRRYVNDRLSGSYTDLFARIDRLALLAAPGFAIVRCWRGEQETALRESLSVTGRDETGVMDDAALDRFVQHYERLTRHILADMPGYADLVLPLDSHRQPRSSP
ncbi:kinase [Sphingobium aromaticiconvertens]|uniref:kinase n=1 Tax=Sphingobium aromaticiconvertens TaxID=365341 RepID=UPI003019E2B4